MIQPGETLQQRYRIDKQIGQGRKATEAKTEVLPIFRKKRTFAPRGCGTRLSTSNLLGPDGPFAVSRSPRPACYCCFAD